MKRTILMIVGLAIASPIACGDESGPTGGDPDGVGPEGPEGLVAIAAFLTEKAADGLLTGTPAPKPVELGILGQDLAQAIAADRGPERVVVVAIDPAVFTRVPVVIRASDLAYVDVSPTSDATSSLSTPLAAPGMPILLGAAASDAIPDPQIQAGVQSLINVLIDLGFETENLQTAVDDTEYHEESDQAAGVLVPPGAEAVTFPIDLSNPLGVVFSGLDAFQTVYVYDGHSHSVFKPDDAADLRAGEVVEDGRLTGAAENALHELIHTVLVQQDEGGKDDDGDVLVSNLEKAFVNKINAELQRDMTGSPDPNALSLYSSFVGQVRDLGGADVLKLLGLPGAAAHLELTAPVFVAPGTTFTMSLTFHTTEGELLESEDVVVDVSGDAANGGFHVLTTDASGSASLQVTAFPQGEISLTVQVLGERKQVTVLVLASGVGQLFPSQSQIGGAYAVHYRFLQTTCSGPGRDFRAPVTIARAGASNNLLVLRGPDDPNPIRGPYDPSTGTFSGTTSRELIDIGEEGEDRWFTTFFQFSTASDPSRIGFTGRRLIEYFNQTTGEQICSVEFDISGVRTGG